MKYNINHFEAGGGETLPGDFQMGGDDKRNQLYLGKAHEKQLYEGLSL